MSMSDTRARRSASSSRSEGAGPRFVSRFATPLTTGLFAVSGVSGVALFFHWLPGTFHAMHVWLSLALLLPFLLHVYKNWRPLSGYAKRGTLILPLVLCLLAALPFAYTGLAGGQGNPGQRMAGMLTEARLADLAPVLKTTPAALLATLKARGVEADSADRTLREVAAASGKEPSQVLFAVLPQR